ncbi:hypothetical protein Hanom_Chr05g00452101 [Helianthus anomalus]
MSKQQVIIVHHENPVLTWMANFKVTFDNIFGPENKTIQPFIIQQIDNSISFCSFYVTRNIVIKINYSFAYVIHYVRKKLFLTMITLCR